MLILGANPVVSNGSLLSAAGISSKLKDIVKKGGKTVVVDPRYTETASHASEHYFIQPGTDAFLLAGIASILLRDGRDRLRYLTKDWDKLVYLLQDYDFDMAAEKTGVPRNVMEAMAKDLLSYEQAICYGRMGVSTQRHGALCQWLINIINILSGNFDRPGGVLFTTPAIDLLPFLGNGRKQFDKRRSRVRQLPDFEGEYPSATLADEILTPGEGQVKALLTVAGNPLISLPNGNKMRKALHQLDLFVAIDFYVNESTNYADYILPPVSPLERSHYDLAFNHLAIKNVARFSLPVFKKKAGDYEDFDILLELALRIGKGSFMDRFKKNSKLKVLQTIGVSRTIDLMLRRGPRKQTLKGLLANPNGIDFGFLESTGSSKLKTSDKKIHLVPEEFASGFKNLMSELGQVPEPNTLKLIGRRNLRTNNSWMHNCKGLHIKKGSFYFQINPKDAETFGVQTGDQVNLKNEIGQISGPVKVSDRISPGVVSVPHGWGQNHRDNRLQHAATLAGASINDIIDDTSIDEISGNAILNGQRVSLVVEQQGSTPS